MNTKILMIISAIILGTTGIILTFIPQEVAFYLNLPESTTILLQISGSLYFGYALLNWTAKSNLIGGIYSKPVAFGNFTHFLIGGFTLIKFMLHNNTLTHVWACAILYLIFALLFGFVLFNNPRSSKKVT